VLKFAEQNNGLMPKDLAQSFSVRAPLASPPFPLRMFEVVCQGLLQEIKDASQTLLIREQEAVRTPDGQWLKCYAFADCLPWHRRVAGSRGPFGARGIKRN